MYRFLRPLLFLLDAEQSHNLTLFALRCIALFPGGRGLLRALFANRTPSLTVEVMGLQFPNPVGLAAGLDKNARYQNALSDLGFGFLELGTVTPLPQTGNPSKRLFRLPESNAIINRMGFNSIGAEAFIYNLRKQGRPGIIGINIGKNKDTANEQAIEDYLKTFTAVYTYADYVVINVSSPNTPGLRGLQDQQRLDKLLGQLKHEQVALGKTRRVYVPIAIKISPDLDDDRITTIAQLALTHRLDAIIATNTTISRPGLEEHPYAREQGGLSGRPLKDLSTAVIKKLYSELQGRVAIIGLGGVENAEDAWEKLVAGADLIQVYTALIYQGPRLVRDIVSGLTRRVETSGCATLAETVAKARSGIHLMR